MGIGTLFTLAVGLSMDAFAVSICKGLAMKKFNLGKAGIVGLWFGGFQALMPLIGYLLGSQFSEKIVKIDHWLAFLLLGFIGANMIKEAFGEDEEEEGMGDSISPKDMLILAVATSIDALAVGVTFAFLKVNIIAAVSFIGVITFTLSVLGVKVGNVFGLKFKSKAEIAGGVILILLGVKILLEHIGIL